MKIEDILKDNILKLKEANIEDANIIARELLAYTLKKDRQYLIINSKEEIGREEQIEYNNNIDSIIMGKPLQYITNKQEFMKMKFFVNESVLIPQPDTEILVEKVLEICNKFFVNQEIKILDLCTGSGAIAISLYKYLKDENKKIFASDISDKAIEVAKLNSKENGTKIEFIQSNMFEQIAENNFDIIVSNPPYIEREELKKLPKDVRHEPHIALDGGNDGLDFYRIIAENAYKYIKSKGILCLEIGYNQKNEVVKILEETGKYDNIEAYKDLSGNDRCIVANIINY